MLNLPEKWRGGGSGRLGIAAFTEYMVFVCGVILQIQQFLNGYTEKAVKGLNQSYFSAFIRIEKDDIEGLMDLEDIAELENQVMQGEYRGLPKPVSYSAP